MEQKNNWVIWKYLSLIRNTELIPEMQTWSHFLTAKKKKKKKENVYKMGYFDLEYKYFMFILLSGDKRLQSPCESTTF